VLHYVAYTFDTYVIKLNTSYLHTYCSDASPSETKYPKIILATTNFISYM